MQGLRKTKFKVVYSDAFIDGVTHSKNLIKAATKILDNTFKDLMKNEEQN